MFRTEIYRIMSRRTVVAGMLVGLLFSLYYALGNTVWGECVLDGSRVLWKEQAIARDKEIAAGFSGPLTEETVRDVWEKYGSPVSFTEYDMTEDRLEAAAAEGGCDNYCSRFVARYFCEKIQEDDGRIRYELPEDLSQNRYLGGGYVFGYTGYGNAGYWDIFLVAYVLVCVVTAVSLSPMFSEDYACRTADIILPAVKGRFVLWRMRMAAGAVFATIYYWIVCGSVFLQHILCYGTEELAVSSGLAGMPIFYREDAAPVWHALLILHLGGWLGILILAAMVCAVSAMSRRSFSSLIRSLLLYIGPFAVMRIVLDALPMGRPNKLLHYICYSMPFSYPGVLLENPAGRRGFFTAILLTAGASAMALGGHAYCRHQTG